MNGVPDGVLCHTQSSRARIATGITASSRANWPSVRRSPAPRACRRSLSRDEAACREAKQFFGDSCVTVTTKQGLSREAAVLYPFEETRQALFEAQPRHGVDPELQPYRLSLPIQAKKQYLVHDKPARTGLVTKEGTIDDVRPPAEVLTRGWQRSSFASTAVGSRAATVFDGPRKLGGAIRNRQAVGRRSLRRDAQKCCQPRRRFSRRRWGPSWDCSRSSR